MRHSTERIIAPRSRTCWGGASRSDSFRAMDASSTDDEDEVIHAYLAGVDRTLIQKNLTLSVQERFEQLMELQRFAAELRRAGERAERT